MSSGYFTGPSWNAWRCRCARFALVGQRRRTDEPVCISQNSKRLAMDMPSRNVHTGHVRMSAWCIRLCSRNRLSIRLDSRWSPRLSLRAILALCSRWPRSSRRARRPAHRMAPTKSLLLHWRLRQNILNGSRLSRLCNRKRRDMLRYERNSHARQHQARQNRHRQHILLYPIPLYRLRPAKHDPLHLIVDPPARLEGIRSRLGREVMQVRLE